MRDESVSSESGGLSSRPWRKEEALGVNSQRATVLAVDDDEIVAHALRRLERNPEHSFRYEIARSCSEAVEMLGAKDPVVILADYQLQDGYGTDLIALARDVPVVVMTGHGSESVAVQALRAGASDYIMKDESGGFLALIGATLDRALARRRGELRERQHAAEHAAALRENVALEQFASLIAKALSVPLQVVDNYCGLLRSHQPMAKDRLARTYATAAQAGSRRAKALVEDVREYSRIAHCANHMATVDCAKLFADCLSTMRRALDRSNIQLEVAALPQVHGSSTSLAALFRRLLLWATHRAGRGGAVAALRTVPLGSDHEFQFTLRDASTVIGDVPTPLENGEVASDVAIADAAVESGDQGLSDQGLSDQGLSDQEVGEFARVPSIRRSRPPGEFGLELGIMTRIVEHHSGAMRVDQSDVDASVLTFSLPAARSSESALAEVGRAQAGPSTAGQHARSETHSESDSS